MADRRYGMTTDEVQVTGVTAKGRAAIAAAEAERVNLRDVDGELITIGSIVHFVPTFGEEPGGLWTTARWGIVTAIKPKGDEWSDEAVCRVYSVHVSENGPWNDDWWVAGPGSLKVMLAPTYRTTE